MKYKKITALPKTAEEIIGIAGCTEFSYCIKDKGWSTYTEGMNAIALKKERIEVKVADCDYDYMSNSGVCYWYWRREWLDDIREEVDWPKVPVNSLVVVKKPSGKWEVQHFAKYKEKCNLIEVWQDGKTSYTTNSTDEYLVDNVELIADEFKGEL